MQITLQEIEIRILGVLIEKALSQSGSYPLTLNSLVAGANQLQNRDPVLQLREYDISAALRTLQHKHLVVQAPPSAGARSNRFEHKALDVFKWDRREQAVMAELMLRGRQTAGELRTHASRMTPFQDVDSVMVTLQGLMTPEHRFVAELPREPGKSTNRFRHLFCQEGIQPLLSIAGTPPAPRIEPPTVPRAATPADSDEFADIKVRLNKLEEQVAFLLARIQEAPTEVSQVRPVDDQP
ncbi:MAG: DUF480 domain-containing protein [Planctomycetota bacterium]